MSRAAALTTLSLRRAATSYRAPLAKASLTSTSTTTTTIPSVSAAAVSRLRTSHHHLFSTSATSYNKMKAVIIKDGKGPADSLYIGEIDTPSPGKNELLVKNKTFGLNRMDILQREGKYAVPPQAGPTLGVEFAGTVVQVGEGTSLYKVGDEVFGLVYGGAYAEYVVAHEDMTLPKPKELSWEEAAGVPENWLTAFQALFIEGNLKKGDNVLIHAGASGVGVAAIQLALHVGGANQVFATAGSDEKIKFIKEEVGRGSDKVHATNYKTQDFETEIKKVTDGVDLIVDFVGKDYFTRNLKLLRRDGYLIYLAFLSGPVLDGPTNIGPLLAKRLTVRGSTLRSRDLAYQSNLLHRFKDEALQKVKDGELKVFIHEVFPWTEVVKAHKEMEANKNSGKIVFEIPQ
ncbi:Quinone oxidoreductase PIG3 [Vanrija pseudolonga]|uniref:Quinone oxidoreductase PIG3 n=1 Tax=Vanrija pseudolonga TaxID=143232 RepID=A0AAF1BLB9_9TREE|nr:Quinone oxidoreductase PIG3 [Vanrija pseudolonga]